jgi:Arc/MetJ-type ribon-helix-helix transcriptional regulator
MEDIFRSLPKVLQETGEADALREPLIFAAWKRIAGENLERNTAVTKLDEKRLVVAVPDEIWKRHLEALSRQMIFKLNSLLGAEMVTFIDFRVDAKQFSASRAEQERKAVERLTFDRRSREELTPELREAAEKIADPEMRKLFLQAAGNCLVRKKDLYG